MYRVAPKESEEKKYTCPMGRYFTNLPDGLDSWRLSEEIPIT
jgi:hypothetical protein